MKNLRLIPSYPKDAASIIVLKKKIRNTFVLMGRRPAKSKFMPNIYVFPGGSVDQSDYKINKYYELITSLNKNKIKTRSNNHTIAIMLAAIRETAEESGLFLVNKNKLKSRKNFIIPDGWNNFVENSLIPDIEKLIYFGRAITPSFLKIRFHARFFIANFDNFIGSIRTNGELEDISWVNIKDAKKLPIADVTDFLIKRLIDLNKDNLFIDTGAYPIFTRKNNKKWIKWD